MSIENAFKLINNNIDEADFTGPIDIEKIKTAEDMLSLKFPKSYFLFLENYGAGDIFGIEFYGIIKDPLTDAKMIPNGIWLTLNLRKEFSLPLGMIVVSESGYGPYYIINTVEKNEDSEAPIFMWDVGGQLEKVSNSFSEFIITQLEELS